MGPGQRIPHPRSGLCRPRGHAFIVPSVPSGLDHVNAWPAADPAGAIRFLAGAPAQYNGSLDFPGPIHVFDISPVLLHTLYLVAIVAEAMTAALSAGRRDMDWMGVCIIACVTALGGGSLRDVLLGHYPLTWVIHPEYLWMTAGARC